MGEEVNRFFAWEICPGGEFQSCHSGRRTAHRSPANGDCTCLSAAGFFCLRFPHPAKAPRPEDIYSPHQRTLPHPLLGPATLPWGLDPYHCPPGGDPKLHFSEEETPPHTQQALSEG